MMTILKRVGYKTAILSGGFTYFGNYLRQKYGFDYVYANELEIEQGKLTGRYVGEVVDGAARPSCCACCASSRRSTSPSRWPSATVPTILADAQPRGLASPSTPNQGEGHGPAVDLDHRAGRHPLFPGTERFPYRTVRLARTDSARYTAPASDRHCRTALP